MNRTGIALALATAMSASIANAQPLIEWDKIQIKTVDLGNRTYMLEGQGGNITIAVGNDGILMVDGQSRHCRTRSRPPSKRSLRCRSNT